MSVDIASCTACGTTQRVLRRWPQVQMFRLASHLDGNGHRCPNPTQRELLTDPEDAP